MEKIETLISKETINKRIEQIADAINNDYKDKEPVLICTLKGAVPFCTDLGKKLSIKCSSVEYIKVSSYIGEKSNGKPKIIQTKLDIEGKDVIVVEDIIDTGYTLDALINDYLKKLNPKSIEVCVLLDKASKREDDNIKPKYTGFIIPDRFVIGYGLDKDEDYRILPEIKCITNEFDNSLENDRKDIINQLDNKENLK